MMSYVIPGLSLVFAFLQNGRKPFEYVKYGYILLENGVKISEQQKETRLICQLGIYTYIYILLILRKAWLQGLANDWKNICFHKYPDTCGRGVKTILVASLA